MNRTALPERRTAHQGGVRDHRPVSTKYVVKFGTTPRTTLIRASLQIDTFDRCATSRTCPIVARPCVSSRTFIAYCSLLIA